VAARRPSRSSPVRFGKLDAGKAQRKALVGMGIKTTDASGKELNGIDLFGEIMKKTKGDVTQLGKVFRPSRQSRSRKASAAGSSTRR
jgi:hypothetical protein